MTPPESADSRLLPHPVTGQKFPTPVPPGSGWPGDPARSDTPVCRSREDILRATKLVTGESVERAHGAMPSTTHAGHSNDNSGEGSPTPPQQLQAFISVCEACPRLVGWRRQLGEEKRAAYSDQPYWSRPVPSFGNPQARRVIVGLAPSGHGSNRTGRNFTGDPSGRWLYRSLFKAGACTRETSEAAGDGMEVTGARIIPPVHCARPENKPTPTEMETCRQWFVREMQLIQPVAILALGQIGWNSVFQAGAALGWEGIRPRPKFGHNTSVRVMADWGEVAVIGCYHPSQRNTSTKLLTEEKLDAAIATFLAAGDA